MAEENCCKFWSSRQEKRGGQRIYMGAQVPQQVQGGNLCNPPRYAFAGGGRVCKAIGFQNESAGTAGIQ